MAVKLSVEIEGPLDCSLTDIGREGNNWEGVRVVDWARVELSGRPRNIASGPDTTIIGTCCEV